jgi:cytochrome P450
MMKTSKLPPLTGLQSDNKDWPRHRHHAAPAFNEKNNNLVWKDALKQTSGMVEDWKSLAPGASNITVQTPQPYLNKIILHVLTSAGFGVELPYTSSSKSSKGSQSIFEDSATPPAGYTSTFRSVSQYMSLNFRQVLLPLSIVPKWIPRSLLPFFKHEYAAYEDMKNYLYALIQLAKDNDAQGRGSHNLLQLLVRSNENTGTEKDYRLTPKELLGNVHIFTVCQITSFPMNCDVRRCAT